MTTGSPESKDDSTTFAESPPRGPWLASAACVACGCFAATVWPPSPLVAAALFGGAALAAGAGVAQGRTRRVGWRLDATGLTEVLAGGRELHHWWAQMRDLQVGDREAVLFTTDGPLVIGARVRDWPKLVAAIRAKRFHTRPQSGPPVPAEVVARWLGIARDEALLVVPTVETRAIVSGCAIGLAGVVVQAVGGILLLIGMALFGDGVREWIASLVERRRAWIRAWPEGLDVPFGSGRREVAWNAIVDVRESERRGWNLRACVRGVAGADWDVVVTDEDGMFRFHALAHGASQLRHAVEHALAARQEGRALPRLAGEGVPAGAISRTRGPRDSGERGISRTAR